MGLFDGYYDPEQFPEGGGLLSRLLTLQRREGQYQPGAGSDEASTAAPAPSMQPFPLLTIPSYGQPSPDMQIVAPDPASRYQALRPFLGDRNAMMATVHPDIGKTLIARALANQADSKGEANAGRPVVSDASSDPVRPDSQYAQGAFCVLRGLPGALPD